MKWPITSETWLLKTRITQIEYLKKTVELHFNGDKCMICQQCVKACPKDALVEVPFVRGEKKPRIERMPKLPDPVKCVACGTCQVVCPYDAIRLVVNGEVLTTEKIPLVEKGILPHFQELKVGKYTLQDPAFSTSYWNMISKKISLKKK